MAVHSFSISKSIQVSQQEYQVKSLYEKDNKELDVILRPEVDISKLMGRNRTHWARSIEDTLTSDLLKQERPTLEDERINSSRKLFHWFSIEKVYTLLSYSPC